VAAEVLVVLVEMAGGEESEVAWPVQSLMGEVEEVAVGESSLEGRLEEEVR